MPSTIVAVSLGLLLLATGCGGDASDDSERSVPVSEHASAGPVDVTLSVSPESPAFGQRASVVLEIVADKGVTIQDHMYESALTEGDRRFEFRVVSSSVQPTRPTPDGRLRWTHQYEVEFFLPGELEIPGAKIDFVDLVGENGVFKSDADPVAPVNVQSVLTDPITLVVRAAEGPALTDAELRDVPRLDPIELPNSWRFWWWAPPLAVMAAVILLVWLLRRNRRRSTEEMAAPIPAHEWARTQLARLVAEDLIALRRVQEFHYRISAIVRGYIERRFHVSAPEMTTEEFLASAANDRRFEHATTQELNRFLTACDLVKYACHQPAEAESMGVLRAAEDFVERTRVREANPDTSRAMSEHAGERAA